MVGGYTKPSVAVAQEAALEVPSCHVCGHTWVQQALGGDAPTGQFTKMDRIDLSHAYIDAPIAVVIHHMRSHPRFNLQNGSKNLCVHTMALGCRHDALVCHQAICRLGLGRCLAKGRGLTPSQGEQAKGK